MPKYWEKQIFSLRRFPEVGQKQKTEREKKKKKRKKERLNDGNNNGPAMYGAWAKMIINFIFYQCFYKI